MDLKSLVALGNSVPKLGCGYLESRPSGFALKLVGGSKNVSKSVSFGGISTCGGIRSLEEKSSKPSNELLRLDDQGEHNVSKKDLSSLPSVLSYCRFSNFYSIVSSCKVF